MHQNNDFQCRLRVKNGKWTVPASSKLYVRRAEDDDFIPLETEKAFPYESSKLFICFFFSIFFFSITNRSDDSLTVAVSKGRGKLNKYD